ncbi:hypothetical protein LEN26_009666 [Aphanomyces euteiches]|nr:hypothetical protein LEN26_009666 [Aphanomyces euteiches]KAH9127760.1 hypothetical protein AeMF1_001978 [Aphanomyces euteiches]KAH9186586.1 hypothetical protein AeNC1_011434 [Aphanomyces euteiches]
MSKTPLATKECFDEDDDSYAHRRENCWRSLCYATARKTIFLVVYVVTTLATSAVVVSWITDAIAARRSAVAPFSIDIASNVMSEYETAYSMCIETAIQESFGEAIEHWQSQQTRFLDALEASKVAMDAIMTQTKQCKDVLFQAQSSFKAVNLDCEMDDQLQLETMSNAWSLRQPASESWVMIQVRPPLHPKVADQVAAAVADAQLRVVKDLNATTHSLGQVVDMGKEQTDERFDHLKYMTGKFKKSFELPGGNGKSTSFHQALEKAKKSIADARQMWDSVVPVVGSSSFPISHDVDASLDGMMQATESWASQLRELEALVNETSTNVNQWQEAVEVHVLDTKQILDELVLQIGNESSTWPTFANWTLRSKLLQQQQHPTAPFFPNLSMANLSLSMTKGLQGGLPLAEGWNVDIEGTSIALPIDLILRIFTSIAIIFLVAYSNYTDLPQLDNQGFTAIQTIGDWCGVLCCRFHIFDIVYSLSLVNLWPFFWTVFICFLLASLTFGVVVPVNRYHSMACADGDETSRNLGLSSFIVNLASNTVIERGNYKAMEGYFQLKTIHERTCSSYEMQIKSIGMQNQANLSAMLVDYDDIFTTVQQFRKCIPEKDPRNSTASACNVEPGVLVSMKSEAAWKCPDFNLTLAALKKPCTSTVMHDFKHIDGREQACRLERVVLEYISMVWVWWIIMATLNLTRAVVLKGTNVFLWRALNGGRIPFLGFTTEDGEMLDQDRLARRCKRQLTEYKVLRFIYCSAAMFFCTLGIVLTVATLNSLQ